MAVNAPGHWHTREASGLRLDRSLKWWHDDQPIEHPNIIEAFNQGLRIRDDGRVTLEFGGDWCFVTVEGCAFAVLATDETPEGQLSGRLSDRTAEVLDLSTLAVDADGALTVSVKAGRARARFSRAAHFDLASHFEFDGEAVCVAVGARRHQTHLTAAAMH